MILLVGTGLWLTFSLRALQFSHLIHAFTLIVRKTPDRKAQGDISNFEALMVALSATVGTGNIAGVATAIYIGGPGALFWMWMTGLVGMATKYAEAVLAEIPRAERERHLQRRPHVLHLARAGLEMAGHALRLLRGHRHLRHRQHGAVQFRG